MAHRSRRRRTPRPARPPARLQPGIAFDLGDTVPQWVGRHSVANGATPSSLNERTSGVCHRGSPIQGRWWACRGCRCRPRRVAPPGACRSLRRERGPRRSRRGAPCGNSPPRTGRRSANEWVSGRHGLRTGRRSRACGGNPRSSCSSRSGRGSVDDYRRTSRRDGWRGGRSARPVRSIRIRREMLLREGRRRRLHAKGAAAASRSSENAKSRRSDTVRTLPGASAELRSALVVKDTKLVDPHSGRHRSNARRENRSPASADLSCDGGDPGTGSSPRCRATPPRPCSGCSRLVGTPPAPFSEWAFTSVERRRRHFFFGDRVELSRPGAAAGR